MLHVILENAVSVLCFAVVLFSLFLTSHLKADFFRPVNVYVFVQCLTLGIAYLKLVPAMSNFNAVTWMVWLGAMASFILGALLSKMVIGKDSFSQQQTPIDFDLKKYFYVSSVLLTVFLIGVFGMVYKVGTFVTLSSDPAKWSGSNVDWGIFGVLVASSPLVVLFWTMLSFRFWNTSKKIRIFAKIVLVLVPVLSLLTHPSRGSFLMSVGFIVMAWNYFYKKISVRLISVLLLLAVVFFMGIASVRTQFGGATLENVALKTALELPYKYIANNFWNLDYLLNAPSDVERHPHTFGLNILFCAFEYFRVASPIRQSLGWDSMFNESANKVYGYNTTGYLWEVYKDFGIFGTVMIPFIVSFMLTFLYEKLQAKPTIAQFLYYFLFLYYVGWSFFCAGFVIPTFWLWLFFIFITVKICEVKHTKTKNVQILES